MADSIIFWNARSILNNLSEFKVFLYCKKPAIVFVSETWLTPDQSEQDVSLVNYTLLRKDRIDRRGVKLCFSSGVILLTKSWI